MNLKVRVHHFTFPNSIEASKELGWRWLGFVVALDVCTGKGMADRGCDGGWRRQRWRTERARGRGKKKQGKGERLGLWWSPVEQARSNGRVWRQWKC